jgi:hypothetical protein
MRLQGLQLGVKLARAIHSLLKYHHHHSEGFYCFWTSADRTKISANAQRFQLEEIHRNTWEKNSYQFASLLLDPTVGDIILVAKEEGNLAKRRLYVYKSLLAANSEYFAIRTSIQYHSYIT